MNSTILSHNRATPSDELYCIFYVRADNCDGENFDLVVIAEGERQAVEIWAQHYYPDEVSVQDESSFIVERWSEEGIGIMMLADHGDLDRPRPDRSRTGPYALGNHPLRLHRLTGVALMPAVMVLGGCICGECRGCPDGWHGDNERCGCTPDCILGQECDDCGKEQGSGCFCDLNERSSE